MMNFIEFSIVDSHWRIHNIVLVPTKCTICSINQIHKYIFSFAKYFHNVHRDNKQPKNYNIDWNAMKCGIFCNNSVYDVLIPQLILYSINRSKWLYCNCSFRRWTRNQKPKKKYIENIRQINVVNISMQNNIFTWIQFCYCKCS